ncbi:hypothetical protein PG984_003012 [Apiospora sp. TS-2023a]
MPYHKDHAPPGTAEELTVEHLLSKRNDKDDNTKNVKTLSELSDQERSATGLVRLGKRCTKISGDPFGLYSSWAGNVSHASDARMLEIMPNLYRQVLASSPSRNDRREAIRRFLTRVPSTEALQLARQSADQGFICVVKNNNEETTIDFSVASMKVQLMHCKDVDLQKKAPFAGTKRYREALDAAKDAFPEAPMMTQVQQYAMACRLLRLEGSLNAAIARISISNEEKRTKFLAQLRSEAREDYWLHSTQLERAMMIQEAVMDQNIDIHRLSVVIKASWPQKWNNGHNDVDVFRQYLADKTAAEKVWELVDADLCVVTDCNRRVIFANLEDSTGLVFDDGVLAKNLADTIDMYSFFTPLPLPETKRHVLDRYIRRLHPELDPARATVEQLHRAKMAVAHYGCWSMQIDPNGQNVFLTRDSRFQRSFDPQYYPMAVFPGFCESVFGRCSDVIRFLVETLDPEYYAFCREVYNHIPEQSRLKTTENDFLSLFALGINGYTQRHRDTSDLAGGMAGSMTFGDYTGGNLCIPHLGLRVRYAPGACTILRGDRMDHLVTDFSGHRYFVIGTNHESVRKHAVRKMRQAGPAQRDPDEDEAPSTGPRSNPDPFAPADYSRSSKGDDETASEGQPDPDSLAEGFPIETPCVNPGCDEDDEEVADHIWTNEELHEAAALPLYDRSSSDEGQGRNTHGTHIVRTYDARFVRSVNAEECPQLVFPEHYKLCRDVYDQLSPDVRLATTKEDFLSHFALGINGYMQRHTDPGDMVGGRQPVHSRPRHCTILRGDKMEHLVTDYLGPRYFVIGTNHEAVRRMPEYRDEPGTESAAEAGPSGDKKAAGAEVARDEFDDPDEELVEFPLETPCVNTACDWDEDEVADHEWTNEELHGAAALPPYNRSGGDVGQ